MPLVIAEFIFVVLSIWFVISQVTIPIIKETKLFPMFRAKEKLLDSLNVEVNQEIEYSERLSDIKEKVKRKKAKTL